MRPLCALSFILWFALATAAFAQPDPSFLRSDSPVTVEGAAGCGTVDTYQQPVDAANFNTARTSDVQPAQQAWEDIVDGGGAIVPFTGGDTTNVKIWGLSIEFNPAVGFVAFCGEDHTANTAYNVEFYADNAGAPAAVPSFTTTATPTSIVDTGIPFAFTTIFEYDLALDAPAPEGYEWVSFVRQTGEQAGNGNDCYWLWLDETLAGTYDDGAFSLANGAEPTDQVMCIEAGVVGGNDLTEVPTMNAAGLAALITLLGLAGLLAVRRLG
jgi:hypothetical protein